MNIWNELDKPLLALAPMDDVTDTVFRRVVAGTAPPDVYFTEFASADGLQSAGRKRVLDKLRFTDIERPLIAQLWGMKPENYYKTARELSSNFFETFGADEHKEAAKHEASRTKRVRRASIGAADAVVTASDGGATGLASRQASAAESFGGGFAGIDINMGCPVPKIVKIGACAALMKDRNLAADIIAATKAGAGDLPVSVKTRVGFNKPDETWTQFLLEQELDALIVHGRTAKQLSKVPNDWDLVGKVKKQRDAINPATIMIGNGDVANRPHALELAKKHQLEGIMIGRGILKDPFAFAAKSPWPTYDRDKRLELFGGHIKLFEETWGNSRNPASLKKFAKLYVNGFDGAVELRAKIMKANSTADLLSTLAKT